MTTEREWQTARRRFVEDAAGAGGRSGQVTIEQLGPLGEQFYALARDLFAAPPERGVLGVLEQVVERARQLAPAAAMVSVTVREPNGTFHTPVETDPLATEADQIQYDTGEGPCVDVAAASSTGSTHSRDLGRDPRYPRFGPRVARLGMAAVMATGMFPESDPPRLGALNYYFRSAEHLDDVDEDMMLLLAAHAAVALQSAQRVEAEKLRSAQLTDALQSRDVIGQAKGILMQRRGVDADEAFDILRRASQDLNVKIRDIATTIASRRAEL